MAYGVLYTASFKDRLQVKSFRVDILQEDYVSGSTSIPYMGTINVALKYHSKKGEEQYIQGSSLTFNFKSLVADNDKYDALFEGYEKERDSFIVYPEHIVTLECGDQVEVRHGKRSFEAYVVGNTIDFKSY